MENLKKLREPAALVALIVLAVRLLLVPATALVYARSDISGIANLVSYRAQDPLLVLVLTALVASCLLDGPTRHARTLAAAALVVVGVAVLVGVIASFAGLADGSAVAAVDSLDQLAYYTVPVLALIALIRLWSSTPGRTSVPYRVDAAQAPQSLPAAPAPPPPDAQYQPGWLPDVAAGAAWQRAGDAAAGAPASGWGTPGQGGGWQVDPSHPPVPGPAPSAPPGWSPGHAPAPPRRDEQPPSDSWSSPRS